MQKSKEEIAMDIRFRAACNAYQRETGCRALNHSREVTWEQLIGARCVETVGRLSWGFATNGRPIYCDPKLPGAGVNIMETYDEAIFYAEHELKQAAVAFAAHSDSKSDNYDLFLCALRAASMRHAQAYYTSLRLTGLREQKSKTKGGADEDPV